MHYRHRTLEPKLKEYLKFFSVVGLTGPRQSGKSTLLKFLLPDYQYISFDDYQDRQLFYDDPEKFMEIYSDKIIFDEAQKVPELFNFIKLAVDRHREQPGKFVLSGSSQFTLLKNISESLAGRIGLLSLLPFENQEIPISKRKQAIYAGSYPELINKNFALSADWYSSYLDTYLHKDIRTLNNIGQLRDYQRMLNWLAAHTSQILNYTNISRDLGLDHKTIKHWISILEASYIIFLLPPYHNNFGKRITKSPKIYFYDTGIVSYLTGIRTFEQYDQGPLSGAIFENYLVSEIIKHHKHLVTHAHFYYLRTNNELEIDLIIEINQNLTHWFEFKKSHTFLPKMTHALEHFYQQNNPPDHQKLFLLYNGKTRPYLEHIKILNYQDYFSSASNHSSPQTG